MNSFMTVKELYAKAFQHSLADRDLYFFGAGDICKNLIPCFSYRDKVKGIFDNDASKQGSAIDGVSVYHSAMLKELVLDRSVFVVASSYYEEIDDQLRQTGARHIFDYSLLDGCFSGRSFGFFGDFATWEEAKSQTGGYEDETILNHVKASSLALFNLADSCAAPRTYLEKNYNFQTLLALLYIMAAEQRLSVLDFGGALGHTYADVGRLLRGLGDMEWSIVEQKNFVDYGINWKRGGGAGIEFFYQVEDALHKNINCLLLSGVLQYLDKPYEYMERFIRCNFQYIVINRTPIFGKRDRIVIQKVHPDLYEASYPAWIFAEGSLEAYLARSYRPLFFWDTAEGMPLDGGRRHVGFKGMILRRI